MAYYYLVASLPSIELDGELPWTPEQFLKACENTLEPSDMMEIRLVMEGEEVRSGHPLLRRWHGRETQLRNAVARHRVARLGIEPASAQREHAEFDVGIERGVADAMKASDPLGRERALDELRWGVAVDLAKEEPFGLGAVLGHALQLRLANRWRGMSDERGRLALEALVESRVTSVVQATRGAPGRAA